MFKGKLGTGEEIRKALQVSQKGKFEKACREVYATGSGSVEVFKRANPDMVPGSQETIPIAEVINDPGFYETMRKVHKDGIFTFRVYSKGTEVHSDHHFGLGTIKDDRRSRAKNDDSDSEGSAAKKETQSIQREIMQQNTRLTEMIMTSKSGGIDMQALLELQDKNFERTMQTQQQMFQLMMERGQGGSSSLEDAVSILDIAHRLQPQIQQEEPMSQLLGGLMPILGNLITAKKQGQTLTPAEMQQITSKIQSVAAATEGASLTAQPPAPGANLAGPGGNGDTPAEAPTPPAAGSIEYFNQRYLDPFRADVASGQSDDELAYQIVSMSEYARDRMAETPPIVSGFLGAETMEDYATALTGFFAAIPELANLRSKCDGIKFALITLLTMPPGAGPAEAVEAVEQAEEAEIEMPTEEEVLGAMVEEQLDQERIYDATYEQGDTVPGGDGIEVETDELSAIDGDSQDPEGSALEDPTDSP